MKNNSLKSKVLSSLMGIFIRVFKYFYFIEYPLSGDLGQSLYGKGDRQWKAQKKRINDIRFNNLQSLMFSQTGAIPALLVTTFFSLLSISFLAKYVQIWLIKWDPLKICGDSSLIYEYYSLILLFIASAFIFVMIFPIILRKVVDHLSAEEYSKSTIGSLNQGELLIFLAYKNWMLIDDFQDKILKGIFQGNKAKIEELKSRPDIDWVMVKNEFFHDLDLSRRDETARKALIKRVESLNKLIEKFFNENFKEIQQCVSLLNLSFDSLKINKRELTLHVLQFSSGIFYENLLTAHRYLQAAVYFLENASKSEESQEDTMNYYIRDFCHLFADNAFKRKRSLEQLIFFEDVNDYIIGLASTRSTSLALKIFMRGISEISSPVKDEKGNKRALTQEELEEQPLKLQALLYRSKSHCGTDLLIHLDNFISKYEPVLPDPQFHELPDYLHQLKYDKHPVALERTECMINMRLMYRVIIHSIQTKHIFPEFRKALQSIKKKDEDSKVYLMVFGYSELLKQCLKYSAKVLNENNIPVFVFRDDDTRALDTRTFRYELNKLFESDPKPTKKDPDDKSGEKVMFNFSAKDSFIKSLVKKNDTVIFIAGAEIYDTKNKKLFHTNRYQERIESILDHFRKLNPPVRPEMWIAAEKYKIIDNFPDTKSAFQKQFYRDYYEIFDLYDLESFKDDELKLISDFNLTEDEIKGIVGEIDMGKEEES